VLESRAAIRSTPTSTLDMDAFSAGSCPRPRTTRSSARRSRHAVESDRRPAAIRQCPFAERPLAVRVMAIAMLTGCSRAAAWSVRASATKPGGRTSGSPRVDSGDPK